jgi:hypothetical protein
MQTRKIGNQGLAAGAIGLGCMGMTHTYGAGDEAESIATVHRALDLGVRPACRSSPRTGLLARQLPDGASHDRNG